MAALEAQFKQKYLDIARTQGAQAALTQLHLDTNGWEFDTFEGREGWKPDQWQRLEEVRAFSRELWESAITNPTASSPQK
jgi:hypothetical protein